MPLTIRRATPSDASTIVAFNTAMALETEALRLEPVVITRGVALALEDDTKALYFVAERDDTVVGQLMITREWSDWRAGHIWWVQSVYVTPMARRTGVFRALFDYAYVEGKKAGAVAIRLYVEKENATARQTYQALGLHVTHYDLMHVDL